MYYPDELIEEIRSKNDIVDVVGSYVRLQKKGSNYWGLCPFHNEKTGSFSVNDAKQMYHCFGCHESGNVFTFLMKYENYTFPEAIKALAERAGVSLPETEMSPQMKARASRRERLMECNKEAATFFYYNLRQPHGEIGMNYLKKRQLSDETIKKFGLGFAGKSGTELVTYLKQKGFEDEIIKSAGLATYSEKSGLRSQFWNRVMFPIFDKSGKVIGFGGRVMGDGEPKYLNSPETEVFDKRRNLYGLSFARKSKADNIIICEGYMDVISMHQAGFDQAVASLGTAFTVEQAALIKKYSQNVYLAYDSDGAGTQAALRNIGILREVGLTGRIINMQPYKDPDEFIKNMGADAFRERILNAENSFFFEARIAEKGYNLNDPDEKTGFLREIARKLCLITEDIERDNYMEAFCKKYSISVENMKKLVMSVAAQGSTHAPIERPKSGIRQGTQSENPAEKTQRILITQLVDNPMIYPQIKKYITVDDFTDEFYKTVVERLFADLDAGKCNASAIISLFEDMEEQAKAASLFNTNLPEFESQSDREKALKEIIIAVKKNSYEYFSSKLGSDVSALSKALEGKKALEALNNIHLTFE